MNINSKILSIPPYISTSWAHIASLHLCAHASGDILVITLLSGAKIEVPHLERDWISAIFTAHARHLEEKEGKPAPSNEQFLIKLLPPSQIAEMEGLPTLLQHNPAQANHPDLPKEILEKIAEMTQALDVTDTESLPKPEENCNCMRCQIARSMQGVPQESKEEIVSDEELTFKAWDVCQAEDKLYIVTNPLEKQEQYHVHLGEPIGCTCGQARCEHIHAVLKT